MKTDGGSTLTSSTDWREDAACKGKTDLFFPPLDMTGTERRLFYRTARAVCEGCPVLDECREYALTAPITFKRSETSGDLVAYGVFAGMSPDQLIEARRQHRKAA